MTQLTREQALALASIIVPAVKQHAQEHLDSLSDEQKDEMHPQALADLSALANIEGEFCKLEPEIDRMISSVGLIAKMFLGSTYAILKVFQTVLEQISAVLCAPTAAPTGGGRKTKTD
jgi:hypothetical protein